MDPELVGRQERVAVRADPVVGDVAEIEEPGESDRDVQAEREQREDEATVPTRRK